MFREALSLDSSPARVGCVWTWGWRWDLLPSGLELCNKRWVSGIGSRCHAPTNTDFSWIHIPEKRNMCLVWHLMQHCWFKGLSFWNDASSCDLHGTALDFFGKYSQNMMCSKKHWLIWTLRSKHASETLMKLKILISIKYVLFIRNTLINKHTSICVQWLFWHVSLIRSVHVQSWTLVNSCCFYSDI